MVSFVDGNGRRHGRRRVPGPGFCFTTRLETVDDFIGRFHAACDKGSLFLKTATKLPKGERCDFKILLANKSPVLAGSAVVLEVFEGTANRFGQPGVRLGIEQLSPESENVFERLLATREAKRTSALPDALKKPARSMTIAGMPALPREPLAPKKFSVPDIMPRTKSGTVPDIAPRTKPPSPPPGRGDRTLSRVKSQSASPVEVRAEGSNETRAADPSEVPAPSVEAAPVHVVPAVAVPIVREPEPPPAPVIVAPEPPPAPVIVAPEPPPARIETRTPGSSYVLPANPLMNISDESLGGFVECTLHEVAAEELVAPDGWSAEPEPAAVPEPIANESTTDATTPVIVPPTRQYVLPRSRRHIAMAGAAAVAVIGIAIALWMTRRGGGDHVAISVPDLSSIAQQQPAATPVPASAPQADEKPADHKAAVQSKVDRKIYRPAVHPVPPAHPAHPAAAITKPAAKAPAIERVPI